jgi:hypothetical protein
MNNSELRKKADAYKVGFLHGLADAGITPDEFKKKADDFTFNSPIGFPLAVGGMAVERGGAALDKAKSILGSAANYGAIGAVGAPLVAGGITGAAEGLADKPLAEDITHLRKQELIENYKKLTQEIHSRMAARSKGVTA